MVWFNFSGSKCRGLVSVNQVNKGIICPQPIKGGYFLLGLLLAVLLLLLLVAPCLNCLEAVKKPPPVAFKVMCLLPIRSEERFSRNAETDLGCRLLLEKKKNRRTRRCARCSQRPA